MNYHHQTTQLLWRRPSSPKAFYSLLPIPYTLFLSRNSIQHRLQHHLRIANRSPVPLHAQTQLLAFMDCFHIIGIVTLIAAPLVLLTKNFKPTAGKSTVAH
jgi:hypothetical protein